MPCLETDLLADLIQRRHRCLIEMRALGLKQDSLIRQGDITRLLETLTAKQKQMEQLQEIDSELNPFRQQSPESRHWRNAETRARCAALISESETLLAEIVAQEKQSEAELCRRRDEASARLQGFHTASQTRGAYAKQAMHRGRLDMSSEG